MENSDQKKITENFQSWFSLSPDSARQLSDGLYALVLFLLASGRIEWWFIRTGEHSENLLPVVLIAFFLKKDKPAVPFHETFQAVYAGLALIFLGFTLAWVYQPSIEILENNLRFAGQIGVGFLLAEWIYSKRENPELVLSVFFSGMLLQFIRTPWTSLADTNLAGPFAHRNTQAAFLLLSLPLVLPALLTRRYQNPILRICALMILTSAFLYVVISRSRSGFIGGMAVLILSFISYRPWMPRVSERRVVALGIGSFLLVVLGLSVLPRFKGLLEEIGDPYHRTRMGIWAAAVHNFKDPQILMAGVGMGDAFDRVLVDSPTGNLNFRYRKAHYPHSLYFNWLYWGGIAALAGWCWLLAPQWYRLRNPRLNSLDRLAPICLMSYAIFELFETSLRIPRVAVMFWIVWFLAFYTEYQTRQSTNDSKPSFFRNEIS